MKFKLTMNHKLYCKIQSGKTIVFAAMLLLFIHTTSWAQNDVKVFNVLRFGAVGDGKTLDVKPIQQAIDAASREGNGAQVFIPGGRHYLIGTLQLKSGIDFHLDGDAELVADTNLTNYLNDAVFIARDAKNFKISGTGSINGRALEFMSHYDKEKEWWIPKAWRPKIFVLTDCKKFEICDISFGPAPSWGLHMLGCDGVLIDNIKINNNLEVPNCDGIDPDHCRNVTIQNCHIVCGDDAIVIKATRQTEDFGPSSDITIKDCIFETQDAGVKIGTETTQDISNITFERCKIKTSSRGICIQLRDSGSVYNITFKDIEFTSRYYSDPWWGRGEAISFTAIPRTPESKIGTIHDITIKNVKGLAENSLRICGTKESRISGITLDNVHITLNKSTKYAGGLFDNRPTKAYPALEQHDNPGIYICFADSITLTKCIVSWGKNLPDYYTHALETDNVTNIKVVNFTGKAAHPDKFKAVLNK